MAPLLSEFHQFLLLCLYYFIVLFIKIDLKTCQDLPFKCEPVDACGMSKIIQSGRDPGGGGALPYCR